MDEKLVDKIFLLQKIPGKGGWTYALIPEVKPDKHNHFGWVRVKGSIDGYQFKAYHMLPMGSGSLFLPVKGEIRKKIGKQAGDYVHIILFLDNNPIEVPLEIQECLLDYPKAEGAFRKITEAEKKAFIEWIYAAKKDETKANRIAQMIQMLENNKTLYSH